MLFFFLPLFLIFLMIGLPVFFGMLAAPGFLLWLNGQERDIALLYRNVYTGMDSFPLMAIPFFMLAGELMNRGGITMRLVEFSQAMIGHLKRRACTCEHPVLDAVCRPVGLRRRRCFGAWDRC
jgi:TRAP-type mannitol/chloroaromatic compound transport system permease large subunit